MPILVYSCPQCEKKIEEIMKLSDPAPTCEDCKVIMKKVLTAHSAAMFKGGKPFSSTARIYGKD